MLDSFRVGHHPDLVYAPAIDAGDFETKVLFMGAIANIQLLLFALAAAKVQALGFF